MKDYVSVTDKAFNLAHLMLKSTGGLLQLYAYLGVHYERTNEGIAVAQGWADEEKKDSRAPGIARYKAAQLLAMPAGIDFALSPYTLLRMGPDYDYEGGVMCLVDGYRYVATCSGQSAKTDLLVASTLMYSMQHPVRFNHFGLTLPTEDFLKQSKIYYEEQYQVRGIESTSGTGDDFHHRSYIPVKDEASPDGEWFIELRWFPNRNTIKPEFHFDLVTPNPYDLIHFVAMCVKSVPEFWNDVPQGTPVGMVSVENNGKDVAVMSRSEWFKPNIN